MFHVHEELCGEDKAGRPVVKFEGYRPVVRLGGNDYGLVNQVFELARPSNAEVQANLSNMSTLSVSPKRS